MARNEQDREDLMREAGALVDRCEIQVEFLTEVVVVGFRRDDSVSFFFGQTKSTNSTHVISFGEGMTAEHLSNRSTVDSFE